MTLAFLRMKSAGRAVENGGAGEGGADADVCEAPCSRSKRWWRCRPDRSTPRWGRGQSEFSVHVDLHLTRGALGASRDRLLTRSRRASNTEVPSRVILHREPIRLFDEDFGGRRKITSRIPYC